MITALTLAALVGASTATPVLPPKPRFLGFLVRGKNPPKATPEEISAYQQKHIENFQVLFKAGKLLTAGPMADPGKTKRGTVILSVDKQEDIPPLFTADPYVAKGFMELDLYRVDVDFGKINTTNIDPSGIVENRIVLFSKTSGPISKEERKAHTGHWTAKPEESGLSFFARLDGRSDLIGVALLRGKNDDAIDKLIASDPLVASGRAKAIKMSQWLSKGVL